MSAYKEIYIKEKIIDIPDYPKKGVIFRDLSPVFQDPIGFRFAVSGIEDYIKVNFPKIDKVVGIEARGFILGSILSYNLNSGFVMARKSGKLPREVISESYNLEYGESTIELQKDSIKDGDKVIIIDDLLATGGTTLATTKLIKELGGNILNISFLVELEFLKGREALSDFSVYSMIQY